MPQEIVEPTADENGDEHHPAFGMAQISRVTSTPGRVLFDSDLRHSHWIELRIHEATRNRNQFAAAAEDVVERSRADIEAMVTRHAEHLGLGPTTLGELES